MPAQELAQRELVSSSLGEQRVRAPVEAHDLAQQPQVARRAHGAHVGQQPGQPAAARVLQAAAGAGDRHAHVRLLRRHAQLGEQPPQVRVGAQVVHDEAGVDAAQHAVGADDVVGVGVPAEPVVGLVERDVGLALQDVGGGQTGHAAADDGDPCDVSPAALPTCSHAASVAAACGRRRHEGSRAPPGSRFQRRRARRPQCVRGHEKGAAAREGCAARPFAASLGHSRPPDGNYFGPVARLLLHALASSTSPTGGTVRFVAGPATAGPWAPTLQHGGPPNALAVARGRAARCAPRPAATTSCALRLAADFVGPVPVGELEVRRPGRAGGAQRGARRGRPCAAGRPRLPARAGVVRPRRRHRRAVAPAPPGPPTPCRTPAGARRRTSATAPASSGASCAARCTEPGPAAAWARPTAGAARRLSSCPGWPAPCWSPTRPAGSPPSSTGRVVVPERRPRRAPRPPVRRRMAADGRARPSSGAHGSALARSTLSDVRGVVGAGLQTLVARSRATHR